MPHIPLQRDEFAFRSTLSCVFRLFWTASPAPRAESDRWQLRHRCTQLGRGLELMQSAGQVLTKIAALGGLPRSVRSCKEHASRLFGGIPQPRCCQACPKSRPADCCVPDPTLSRFLQPGPMSARSKSAARSGPGEVWQCTANGRPPCLLAQPLQPSQPPQTNRPQPARVPGQCLHRAALHRAGHRSGP